MGLHMLQLTTCSFSYLETPSHTAMTFFVPSFPHDIRPFLQLVLFGVFIWQFGTPAMEKYLLGKVMVVRHIRRSEGIPPPSVTVFAGNVEAWSPWRGNISGDATKVCGEAGDGNISNCIEDNSYKYPEVIKDVVIGNKHPQSLTLKYPWSQCHISGYTLVR